MPKRQRIFCLSKANQNQHLEFASVFHKNCIKKINQNNVDFYVHRKSTSKWHRFFAHRNYVEKSTSKQHDFLLIKIGSSKVRRNEVDFSLIEFMLNKARQKGINFSPIEITAKKLC